MVFTKSYLEKLEKEINKQIHKEFPETKNYEYKLIQEDEGK